MCRYVLGRKGVAAAGCVYRVLSDSWCCGSGRLGSVGGLNPVLTKRLPSTMHHADITVQCTRSWRSKNANFYRPDRASFLPKSLSNCILRAQLFHWRQHPVRSTILHLSVIFSAANFRKISTALRLMSLWVQDAALSVLKQCNLCQICR